MAKADGQGSDCGRREGGGGVVWGDSKRACGGGEAGCGIICITGRRGSV